MGQNTLLLDDHDFIEFDYDDGQKNNLSVDDLPISNLVQEKETENFEVDSKLNDYVKDTELKAIEDAVKVSATRVEAAKKLGISPRTLRYKIAKFKESGFEVAL